VHTVPQLLRSNSHQCHARQAFHVEKASSSRVFAQRAAMIMTDRVRQPEQPPPASPALSDFAMILPATEKYNPQLPKSHHVKS